MRSMAGCVAGLGKGRAKGGWAGNGGAWVVGVEQAGQAGEVEGMESGSMGQGGSRRSWKGGGRSGQRAEGAGMHWGPLKSAEKPHPWAVDHEPMGPGAMGPVWGWGRLGVGVGVGVGGGGGASWKCGKGLGVGVGLGVLRP